jgi:hypothetical protein
MLTRVVANSSSVACDRPNTFQWSPTRSIVTRCCVRHSLVKRSGVCVEFEVAHVEYLFTAVKVSSF